LLEQIERMDPILRVALVAALLAMAAFANALDGEFVLDDGAFLVDNPNLTEPHDLAYFFTGEMYSYGTVSGTSATYRPFFFAVLWLGNALWPGSAPALHLLSLGLHVVATLLVLAALRRLIPDISPLAAGLGACLFAVHPVHVEAVAWISAFVHPMATVFVLAALLAHDRHQRTKTLPSLGLAGLFFVAALLTAETAAGFPFFVFAWDWIRYGRPQPLRAAPYFAVLAIYAGIRRAVLGESLPLNLSDPDAWLRLPVFLAEYLRHLILPDPSQPLYLAPPPGWGISVGTGVAAAFLVGLLLLLIMRRAGDRRGPLLAAAWIGAALLPSLAGVFNPSPLFALRSLYLPSVGIAILVAWFISASPHPRRKIRLVLVAAILPPALVLAVMANGDWRDDGRVYGRIIALNPGYYGGYIGMARYLKRTGRTGEAVSQYEKAIAFAGPGEKAKPLESLALLLGQSGEYERSLELFSQVTILEPRRSSAWVGAGNNLWYLGRLPEAAEAYRKAHAADAGNREACYNLVLVLGRLGRNAEAARYAACAARRP